MCFFLCDFIITVDSVIWAFLKFYLNIIADNEPVEDKEREDDGHGEGDEAKLEGVHLCLYKQYQKKNIFLLIFLGIIRYPKYVLTAPSTLCCLSFWP